MFSPSQPPCPDQIWGHLASCPADTEVLSPAVKRLGHEADHSPASSAKVKNAWGYTSTSQNVFMA